MSDLAKMVPGEGTVGRLGIGIIRSGGSGSEADRKFEGDVQGGTRAFRKLFKEISEELGHDLPFVPIAKINNEKDLRALSRLYENTVLLTHGGNVTRQRRQELTNKLQFTASVYVRMFGQSYYPKNAWIYPSGQTLSSDPYMRFGLSEQNCKIVACQRIEDSAYNRARQQGADSFIRRIFEK